MSLSKKRAFIEIFLSTLIISGGTAFYLHYWLPLEKQRENDPRFNIVSIIQTGPQKEALKTVYLAELLSISCDRPTSIYRFNCKKAEAKLLKSPVIKEAHVTVLAPGSVYIDYTVRKPIAWLGNYHNRAIDEEGHVFPIYPFFTPKNLPEIYLSKKSNPKELALAFKILKLLPPQTFSLKRIDVANAFAPSCGSREIVLITESTYLRLSTKNYQQELGNYLSLRPELSSDTQIIDLRIPKLAFIKTQK